MGVQVEKFLWIGQSPLDFKDQNKQTVVWSLKIRETEFLGESQTQGGLYLELCS